MISDAFEKILSELGILLGIELKPDQNRTCQLVINQSIRVQIEQTPKVNKILIGTNIAMLPSGSYAIEVLKEALKCNLAEPRIGKMAFSSKNQSLVLFEIYPLSYLSASDLHLFLRKFTRKAQGWKKAIEEGAHSFPAS